MLRVLPVNGRRALRQFIALSWSLYAKDPVWIPPLVVERLHHFSSRNPYFDHAQVRYWIAYRGEQPVGRISAQIDDLHLKHYADHTGFWGMLEAEDDPQTFRALLQTAEDWLRKQGMNRIRGPFNFSINDECGLLVEGFDSPPMIMMGHAHQYYASRLEENLYEKVKDLLAYSIGIDFTLPAMAQEVIARTADRVNIRPLRKASLQEDLRILRNIFEDAWSENWGFIPFTDAEFAHVGQNLRFLVPEEFVQIAEVDGEPAAMIVAFPNVNEAIRDLNGRLFPFNWMKLVWRLKMSGLKTARVALMGVRKRYQGSAMGAALAFMVIDAVRYPGVKRGVQQVELSWILEDNSAIRNILQAIGGKEYKRYRIYEKELR